MTNVREPRQERSKTTRRRLLDACVECIVEWGWAGSTVAGIAERAGVSRGAAQHHFPTREDLVTTAVEHVGEVQLVELRRRAAALPTGKPRTEAIVGMLLDLYTGPMFRVGLHLWVAASTDDALRATVAPLEARVGREVHRVAVDLLGIDESHTGVRETVQATLDLARGLGLANLLTDDANRRKQIARQWVQLLEPVVAPAGEIGTGTASW